MTPVFVGCRGIERLGHGDIHEGGNSPAVHRTARVEVPIFRPHPNDRAAFFRLGQLGPHQLPETAFLVHADMFPRGGSSETGVQACGFSSAAGSVELRQCALLPALDADGQARARPSSESALRYAFTASWRDP
jgi:hypothetical protein